jgi:hypothetical protein
MPGAAPSLKGFACHPHEMQPFMAAQGGPMRRRHACRASTVPDSLMDVDLCWACRRGQEGSGGQAAQPCAVTAQVGLVEIAAVRRGASQRTRTRPGCRQPGAEPLESQDAGHGITRFQAASKAAAT